MAATLIGCLGSSGLSERASIVGVIMWFIGIFISSGVLREDPKLANVSASIFSFLGTWVRLKFSKSEANF